MDLDRDEKIIQTTGVTSLYKKANCELGLPALQGFEASQMIPAQTFAGVTS
jgi:hypothetical protein